VAIAHDEREQYQECGRARRGAAGPQRDGSDQGGDSERGPSRARGQVPAIVILLGSGRGVDRLLHWSGETLLVTGILMAAKGISDVRRARTKLPGWSWPLAWQAGHPWGPSKVIVGWV